MVWRKTFQSPFLILRNKMENDPEKRFQNTYLTNVKVKQRMLAAFSSFGIL